MPRYARNDRGDCRATLARTGGNKIQSGLKKKTNGWKNLPKLAKIFFNRHTFVIFYVLYLVKNTNKCSDLCKKRGSTLLQKLWVVG